MIRGDLSNRLIHLTRGNSEMTVEQVFDSILKERRLRGSAKDIRGGHAVVCFTEAPLTALAQVMASAPGAMRYQPFGVMVSKDWLYARGGRPVIYGEPHEYEELPASMQYRYVRYRPEKRNGDWTWEREWRIAADALPLNPEVTTLIVPRRMIADRHRIEHHDDNLAMSVALGEDAFLRVDHFRWHFVALEDLGIDFPAEVGGTTTLA
ncbi:hypothetical protein [Cupriavidus pinatubonensis]|uniref:hypothetical protein n=1 Tax=Cupriavidus pinatubonensis TaxID=248026 RepID=UPI00112D9B35|nr:hypothetical protein [Cupriavidus pinatubonensis]TPQ32033.1 hypothetical protein C2U69_27485 [Cupriavidus pinatubonensis]